MMYLAAKHKATSSFGKLIQFWTRSKYCHVELVFSDCWWFSARELRDSGAVYFEYGCPTNETVDMYDLLPLPFTPEQEHRIKKWCVKEQTKDDGTLCGYDKRGVIFSFLPIPIGWQSAEDWFCSEICVAALQTEGWFTGYSPASVSPKQIVELYYKEMARVRWA